MLWLSKRCIIIRKKEMFNLCDMLVHHMNYSIWGILSPTKLTNIGILVLLNSHDHSNLDTKTNCDHQIYSHICNNVELPPMVNPPPPLTTLSPFWFRISTKLSHSTPILPSLLLLQRQQQQQMQMIIWRGLLLANDHSEGLASCEWSSGEAGLLQMIIRRGRPLANNHLEVGLLQMIIRRDRPLANNHLEVPASCK